MTLPSGASRGNSVQVRFLSAAPMKFLDISRDFSFVDMKFHWHQIYFAHKVRFMCMPFLCRLSLYIYLHTNQLISDADCTDCSFPRPHHGTNGSIDMLSFYHPPLAGTLCGACVTTDNTTQPSASPAFTPISQFFLRNQQNHPVQLWRYYTNSDKLFRYAPISKIKGGRFLPILCMWIATCYACPLKRTLSNPTFSAKSISFLSAFLMRSHSANIGFISPSIDFVV